MLADKQIIDDSIALCDRILETCQRLEENFVELKRLAIEFNERPSKQSVDPAGPRAAANPPWGISEEDAAARDQCAIDDVAAVLKRTCPADAPLGVMLFRLGQYGYGEEELRRLWRALSKREE